MRPRPPAQHKQSLLKFHIIRFGAPTARPRGDTLGGESVEGSRCRASPPARWRRVTRRGQSSRAPADSAPHRGYPWARRTAALAGLRRARERSRRAAARRLTAAALGVSPGGRSPHHRAPAWRAGGLGAVLRHEARARSVRSRARCAREESKVLKDDRHAPSHHGEGARVVGTKRMTRHRDLPLIRRVGAVEQAEKRRLSCAARPRQKSEAPALKF